MTRKEAASNQISLAIRLFHEEEFAGAITLALAAEGQMPPTMSPHVLKTSKDKAVPFMAERDFVSKMNEVRDWLKHHKDPEEMHIYEIEAFFAVARATSKFCAVYDHSTPEIETFVAWYRANLKNR
ncbi:hypothetical protein NKH52_30995 [Mesorhizobium sp. M1066]|uniref:hypothetical protein n=1 Tax=unclassified Mesorhizobium TaxID=325217 RepID=UPI00333BB7CD